MFSGSAFYVWALEGYPTKKRLLTRHIASWIIKFTFKCQRFFPTGCQTPVPPNHGYVNAPNGYARAYKIYYSCAPGYVLHGDADRDCLAATLYAGGQDYWLWGSTDPVCLIGGTLK